jgi:hypothetical protein
MIISGLLEKFLQLFIIFNNASLSSNEDPKYDLSSS